MPMRDAPRGIALACLALRSSTVAGVLLACMLILAAQ